MPEPIRLEFSGRTLPALFENAAQGMSSLLIDPAEVSVAMLERIHVEASDLPGLMLGWLNQLLFIFQVNHLAHGRFRITHITETSLDAEVAGELMDPFRHHTLRSIKSAVSRDLSIKKTPEGYLGSVLFDV